MSVTATQRLEIEKLLVLMFNAAPGASYLSQVVGLHDAAGQNLQTVANALDDIPVFQQLHPNFQTAAEFAADFLTPLGLQADAIALGFVTGKFNAGMAKGEIMYQGLQALNGLGSGAAAQYLAAKAILENKAAASDYYSVTKSISNADVGILQTVLDGITADPASVTAAEHEIDAGTRGVQGVLLSFTTSQDSIIGTNAADLVNGLFGGGGSTATYSPGDQVDGGGGTDRIHLVATGTDASATVIVKNVESIDIQDTVGATFDALLVENRPGIGFTNTLKGQTSTVTNAALACVVGLAGKGNLVVDYAATSGTSDTANVALNGVGTSATDLSTVNVNDANTVEAVNVATTGANFVNLLAGSVAGTVSITGDGTNTFTMGSIKTASTIDASASTGTNIFNLGNTLGNGDVVKGGAGADTVSANVTTAFGTVTLTGVETLKADIDADVAMNLGTSTGLKTLTLADGGGSLSVTNATSELTTVNYQSTAADDTDNDFSLAYKTGQAGNLALNLNTATASQPLELDDLNFTRAESIAINALGSQAVKVSTTQLDDTTKSLAITAGDSGGLYIEHVLAGTGTKSALQSIALTAGEDSSLSFYNIAALGAQDVAIDMAVASGGNAFAYQTNAASFGDITLDVAAHAVGTLTDVEASDGGVGDLSMTVGSGGSSTIGIVGHGDFGNIVAIAASGATELINAKASGGDVGDVTVDLAGARADTKVTVTAQGRSGDDGMYAGGGNVGDIVVNVDGVSGQASTYIFAKQDDPGGDGDGGNIGTVTLTAAGSGASNDAHVYSNGGDQGDYAIHVGDSAGVHLVARAQTFAGDSGHHGNIGDITVDLEDKASLNGDWNAHGSIGSIAVDGGDDAQVILSVNGDQGIGSVDIELGERASLSNLVTATQAIGDVHLAAGEDSRVAMGLRSVAGEIGAIEVTAGTGSSVLLETQSPGSATGNVIIAGGETGDMASATLVAGSVAGVDLHGWLGTYVIDASEVSVGATILAGAGGGVIHGTDGADDIQGGAGSDSIFAGSGADIIDGGEGSDAIGGGAGSDIIDGGDGDDGINGNLGVDVMTGGAGADIFDFSEDLLVPVVAIASAAVTDEITDFATTSDKLQLDTAGSAANYLENTAPVASMLALLTAADMQLNSTVQYYFGVVGTNGYLIHSADGTQADMVIQLTGVFDMAYTDIY